MDRPAPGANPGYLDDEGIAFAKMRDALIAPAGPDEKPLGLTYYDLVGPQSPMNPAVTKQVLKRRMKEVKKDFKAILDPPCP